MKLDGCPLARAQAVRQFDLGEGDCDIDGPKRRPGTDHRPRPVQPKQRREGHGDAQVKAQERGASRKGAYRYREGDLARTGRLTLHALPKIARERRQAGKDAPHVKTIVKGQRD